MSFKNSKELKASRKIANGLGNHANVEFYVQVSLINPKFFRKSVFNAR